MSNFAKNKTSESNISCLVSNSLIMNKVSGNPLKNRRESTMPLMAVTALFVNIYLV